MNSFLPSSPPPCQLVISVLSAASIYFRMRRFVLFAAALILLLATLRVPAQESAGVNPNLFSEMKWRSIGRAHGPHSAGRTRAADGPAPVEISILNSDS